MIKTISLDIETYSSVDISKSGVYKYAESDDFEILLLSYSLDEGEIHTIDLAMGERVPEEVLEALVSDEVEHWAYNSSFERICLSSWLRKNRPDLFKGYGREDESTTLYFSPSSWYCDMVLSAYSGLPLSLKGVGAVLKLDEQKDEKGKPLIKFFCTPSAYGERHYYYHDIIRWEEFKDYNAQDVRTEMAIHKRLNGKYPVPQSVWEEYHVSETINDRGIRVDMDLVRSAIALDKVSREDLTQKLSSLTLLDNPNSVTQMKGWLKENGIKADTLGKKSVQALLKNDDMSPEIKETLSLRLQLAKSSIRKYDAIESCVCRDGRVHGMFMFYGANRTGRFSGRIVQLQNLRANHIEDLENARELVKTGDSSLVETLYDDVPDTLSQLIRTAFIPREGYKFIVADYSAIEARVLAWLAGEQWVLDVFASGGDIYCETASRMFGVPVVKHGINGDLRQKGKQATLSCGYGGGVGALKAMGAIEAGMKEEELKPLVDAWRAANPNIVSLWWDTDEAVKTAIRERTQVESHGLLFEYKSGMLFISLPSGRHLSYVKPKIETNQWGGESVTYEGVGNTKKWERLESYGPKFVENCIAEGTLVITNRGLIPIEEITPEMLIWDGDEFVKHDGLIYQGIRDVISLNGIYMTSEHKILTDKGWIESAKANGFNWATVSLPNGFEACREYSTRKYTMAVPLHMWEGDYCNKKALNRQKTFSEIVRMHEAQTNKRFKKNPRNVPSSGMGCMAQHEAEVSRPESSCLEKLRRTWHQGLRQMAGKFRELLGRHGNNMAERPRLRPHRQRRELLPGELQVDDKERELPQQKEYDLYNNSVLETLSSKSVRAQWHRKNNIVLPDGTSLACRVSVPSPKLQKQVYDIRNCGPRHRFSVWNGERALIVSNCVQAISRDVLCSAMTRLQKAGIATVAHVHDETINEVPMDMTVEEVAGIMSISPEWMKDIQLTAAGYECSFYMKD